MVSPTQSAPQVPAVWLCNVKDAAACRYPSPSGERSEQRAGGTRLWLAPHSQRRRCRLCGGAIIKEAVAMPISATMASGASSVPEVRDCG